MRAWAAVAALIIVLIIGVGYFLEPLVFGDKRAKITIGIRAPNIINSCLNILQPYPLKL